MRKTWILAGLALVLCLFALKRAGVVQNDESLFNAPEVKTAFNAPSAAKGLLKPSYSADAGSRMRLDSAAEQGGIERLPMGRGSVGQLHRDQTRETVRKYGETLRLRLPSSVPTSSAGGEPENLNGATLKRSGDVERVRQKLAGAGKSRASLAGGGILAGAGEVPPGAMFDSADKAARPIQESRASLAGGRAVSGGGEVAPTAMLDMADRSRDPMSVARYREAAANITIEGAIRDAAEYGYDPDTLKREHLDGMRGDLLIAARNPDRDEFRNTARDVRICFKRAVSPAAILAKVDEAVRSGDTVREARFREAAANRAIEVAIENAEKYGYDPDTLTGERLKEIRKGLIIASGNPNRNEFRKASKDVFEEFMRSAR